jgi:energy-coupling factor transporter ATP-binding protein EcfA2
MSLPAAAAPTSTPAAAPSGLTSVRVKKLFGRYTYNVPLINAENASYSKLLVLYGDNGSGKTTLLRLLFFTLSPSPSAGHKTSIARIPFSEFEILLTTGASILLRRAADLLLGSFDILIRSPHGPVTHYQVQATKDNRIRSEDNPDIDTLLKHIQSIAPAVYFLPDDRRFQSTSEDFFDIEDLPSTYAAYMRHISQVPPSHREIGRQLDHAPPAVHAEIAVARLTRWIRDQTLARSSEGDINVNEIYLELMRQISQQTRLGRPSRKKQTELIDRIT